MVLEVKEINKFFKKDQALNNVSFEVEAWEIYWFLWQNWAGKTTTMKCIMWLIKPKSGEIKVLWWSIYDDEIRSKIWFMPENTYLYKYLKWGEFLRFNWKFFWLKWKALEEKVDELLKKVWLENAKNKFLKDYSKWMLQRIGLAQSIINDPKLLFLDEPMSWLDPIGRRMVKDLLVELKNKWTTIFFNTHILADVESICDRVSIIHKWKILVSGKKISNINESLEDYFIETVMNSWI